jgi:hypothetical protein
MKLRPLTCVVALLVIQGAATLAAQPQIPEELLILAAQPSVYQVWTYGDFELKYPSGITLEANMLQQDAAADRKAGSVKEGRDDVQQQWLRLATNVDRYLSSGPMTQSLVKKDAPFGSGTAFAVSREGILLSNAHVFADEELGRPSGGAGMTLLEEAVVPFGHGLVKQLGGTALPDDGPMIADALLKWFSKHSRISAKFRSAKLVLKYDRSHPFVSFEKYVPPRPITIPLEILAIGEVAPGKDVAVLKAIMQPDQREKLKASGARPDEIEPILKESQEDKLICLPLGDSDDVLPGTNVNALGFPGNVFLESWMTAAAQFRVSARDGKISQTKPVKGGYEMLEMTAGIDHGDSGGPVLNREGKVIGINVGGGEGKTTLAVPINVAKEFLAKARIKPNPGKLSTRWAEAVVAFGKKDYAKSQELLWLIERNQGSEMTLLSEPNPLELAPAGSVTRSPGSRFFTDHLVNPYVRDLQKRAQPKPR